ncbi:MAG: SDR family NAD(P)-dependent oxidoreductase [Polyangiaceae bacterium]
MKILVTGGSGFLGSHVVEQLVREGHDVRVLVRKSSNRKFLESLGGEGKAGKVEFAYGSVEDAASVDAAVTGVEAIVHSAGLVKARTLDEFTTVNVEGTKNLLEAAKKYAKGLKRFVHVSSLEAIGPSEDGAPLLSNHPPNPVTHYGRSKLAAERAVIAAKDELPVTIVRPTGIYGPRDVEMFSVFQSVQRGVLPLIGSGDNTMTLVYGADAAEACIRAIFADVPSGSAYFVDDGTVYTWKDAVLDVERAIGKRAFLRKGLPLSVLSVVALGSELAGKITKKAVMLNRDKLNMLAKPHWVSSSVDTRRDLGWSPKVGWAEGCKMSVKWYRDNGWL